MGSIDKVELKPTNDPAKHDQLQVQYIVIDGEATGRKQSEFLSLSPKAAFRLKKWFNLFGLADEMTGLDVDDDTNLLNDPDLVGVNVIFEVYQDPKLYQGEVQIRTRLTEVLDDEASAPAPTPAPRPAAAAAPVKRRSLAAVPAPAPEVEADDDQDEDQEPEPEAVAAAAPAPRRFGQRPQAAAAPGPARRTLR